MADETLFPVGHYHGRFFPGPGEPLRYHHVRRGLAMHRLDEQEFRVWALVHGLADRPDDAPWSRREVETEARADGLAASTGLLDDLLRGGLVVAVPTDPGAAEGFARAHRLHALLAGLGNTPEDTSTFAIGVVGFAPVVTVLRTGAELWQWAPYCADLWQACAVLAEGARAAGETDPERTDQSLLLDRAIPVLRRLVSRNAAYLDAVGAGSDGTTSPSATS